MPDCTIFFDVDNTLIDNDRAKAALADRLRALLGAAEAERFWATYEAVRTELGMVDIPRTLGRFQGALTTAAAVVSDDDLAAVFATFPYPEFLFPASLEVLATLTCRGARVAILSDGDAMFQPHKIWRAGLTAAVDGAVIVVPNKIDELDAAMAYYPAPRFVFVDDKPAVLEAARGLTGRQVTTVHIARGHYGTNLDPARLAQFDLRLSDIGELPAALAATGVAARRTPGGRADG